MEMLTKDDKKAVFFEELENQGKEVYTMFNLRHKDSGEEYWKLLFYDVYDSFGEKEVSITGTLDDNGDYLRITEHKNKNTRSLFVNKDTVIRDYVMIDDQEEVYYQTNNFLGYKLSEYFDINPKMNEKNRLLKNFVEQDELLREHISSKKK